MVALAAVLAAVVAVTVVLLRAGHDDPSRRVSTPGNTEAGVSPNNSTLPPPPSLVPKIIGLSRADAEVVIVEFGCSARISFRDVPPDQEGTVIDQSPPAGQPLRCAADVFLNITVGT